MIQRIVLDANVALDWVIPSTEGFAYSYPLLKLGENSVLEYLVPTHFHAEVARLLVIKGRNEKQPLGEKWIAYSADFLDSEPITTAAIGMSFKLLCELAKTYNLSAPDTGYFHLARVLDIPIASRDKGIIAACKTWNVHLWQPPA